MGYSDTGNAALVQIEDTKLRNDLTTLSTSVSAQLVDIGVTQINKNKGKFDQTYLTDELLQQIAGTAPINAIPADKTLTTNKFADLSVTPSTTSFVKLGKNKFDGLFSNAILTGSSTFTFAVSATGKSAIVKVKPNTTYTIYKTQDTDRFRVGAFVNYPIAGAKTTNLTSLDGASTRTITTTNDENYLVIYVSSDTQGLTPQQLQVEEGSVATEYVTPNTKLVIDLDGSSIPAITPEKTTFVKRGRNIFNGEYDNRYIASGSGSFTADGKARTSKRMEVKPNTIYTLSGGNRNVFRFVDANGVYISHLNALTSQSPSNAKYMYVYYSSDGSHQKVQIEEGSVATEYTPYDAVVIKLDRESFPGTIGNAIEVPNFIITDDVRGNYTSSGPYISVASLASDVNNLYAIYDELVTLHSDYVTKTLLGNEVTGLPIYRYDFIPPIPKSLSGFENPKALYVSGIHGHEKRAMLDGARFFADLAKNWKTNSLLNMLRWNVHFIVIPSLNPYGFNNNQRKNGNGVDLNRNFANGWTINSDPASTYYPGVAPLSEIESQLMDNLLEQNKNIIFAVDHHNYNAYPTDSSHIIWMDSSNANTKKMLIGTANYLNSKVKSEYPFVEQENNSLTAIIHYSLQGMHYQFFNQKKIAGAILETVTHMGGTDSDTRQFGTDVVGNLFLSAIRNHNTIKVV